MSVVMVKQWLIDEVSTRNCTHCRVSSLSEICYCAKGYMLLDLKYRPYSYDNVMRYNGLLEPCKGCKDFKGYF